jgi:hypothetical protein
LKTLRFSSVAELATGLAAVVDPVLLVRLLLGAELSGVGVPVARCFGVALLGLGLACWPRQGVVTHPAWLGMLVYNLLIALYLAFLGTVGHLSGPLLWPAVVLHAAVAVLLGIGRKASP